MVYTSKPMAETFHFTAIVRSNTPPPPRLKIPGSDWRLAVMQEGNVNVFVSYAQDENMRCQA